MSTSACVGVVFVISPIFPMSFYRLYGPRALLGFWCSPGDTSSTIVDTSVYNCYLTIPISVGCINYHMWWLCPLPYKGVLMMYKSGSGGVHICIYTLCLLMAEIPLMLFCILHLFLSLYVMCFLLPHLFLPLVYGNVVDSQKSWRK